MKKILIISPCNLPIPSVLGGAVETLIDNLINENEKSKNTEFTIISIYNKESILLSKKYVNSKFIYIKKNIIVEKLDNILNYIISFLIPSKKNQASNFIWKIKVLTYLKKYLNKNDFDRVILENQGYYTKLYKYKSIRKKYKNKLYYHLHNLAPNNLDAEFLKHEKILVISNFLKLDIVKRYPYANQQNILILKNGINCKKFQKKVSEETLINMRKKFGFAPDDIIVCFVGRIVPEKGILEVLQAIKKIENTKIKILIVGSLEFGKDRTSAFETQIKDMCLELKNRAVMTGFVPNAELYAFYKMCQIAVLPSIWEEPGGLTMIESLMTETPLITTNSGGIPEYIEEKMAIILDRNNELINSLKNSIIEVTNNLKGYKEISKKSSKIIEKKYNTQSFYKNFIKSIEN